MTQIDQIIDLEMQQAQALNEALRIVFELKKEVIK